MSAPIQFSFNFGGRELVDSFSRFFGTPVVPLFQWGGPTHIFWGVAAIIVYAIKAVIWRSFANIKYKLGEVIPTLANFYSASPVVMKCVAIWVVTAGTHSTPHLIERVVVFSISRAAVFLSVASARSSAATLKISKKDSVLVPAVTLAEPLCVFIFATANSFDRNQSTKTLTRDIFEFGHDGFPISCYGKWRDGVPTPSRCAL